MKTLLRASVGVAVWDGSESGQAMLARADQEVYRGKQSGGRARLPVVESQPVSVATQGKGVTRLIR